MIQSLQVLISSLLINIFPDAYQHEKPSLKTCRKNASAAFEVIALILCPDLIKPFTSLILSLETHSKQVYF